MNVCDRVSLADGAGTHYGIITTRTEDGMCSVKWDSGITEKLHEAELTFVEDERVFPPFEATERFRNDPGAPPYITETGRVLTDPDIEALSGEAERGYDVGKSEGWRERLDALRRRLRK